jgi:hypothetical protein
VEAMGFGYCMEVIFHRDARSLLESSARLGMTNSDEEGCIGRKLVAVDEVEGSYALVNLVSSD